MMGKTQEPENDQLLHDYYQIMESMIFPPLVLPKRTAPGEYFRKFSLYEDNPSFTTDTINPDTKLTQTDAQLD